MVDTLSSGFRTLNRHPYLLIVPVVLDLLYWLGPRLSVQPIAQRTVEAIERLAASPAAEQAGGQTAQSLAMLKSIAGSLGSDLNLLAMLSAVLSVPSWLLGQDLRPPAWLGGRWLASVSSSGDLVNLLLSLFVLGALVGGAFRGLAAQVVRDGQANGGYVARRVGAYALRFLGLIALAVVATFVFGLPLAMIFGLVALISPLLGSLAFVGAWAWFYLYTFFTLDALFVSEVGPLRAIANSITVVRRSSSSTVGLFVLTLVISLGMPFVWSALGPSDAAVLVAILGNAYIGTGLIVASMIFYRDRVVKHG